MADEKHDAATAGEALAPTDMAWFTHARLGMFIHWGLYALGARHEWLKNRERMTDEAYQKYFDHFDPDLYDPEAWAAAARAAGMRYAVLTTKHHEGFCLWDSAYTDYKAPNTPCGKDLVRPFVDAFRAAGLHIGFYHSLIDWHHPEYPVDKMHPQRDNEGFRAAARGREVGKYAEYLHNQATELLTKYGKIDYVFYDFSFPGEDGKGRDDWRSEELMRLTRRLQPGIIINDRLDLMDTERGWDVTTPEQVRIRQGVTRGGQPVAWETCQTFSGSWGYHRDESTWQSTRQLVIGLIDTVSKGGNFLLNVGPTARGTFDERAMDRLAGIGAWMRLHERAIHGCTQAPPGFSAPEDCRLTYNPETNRLYVHILAWPYKTLHLPGLVGKVAYAQLLNDASEVFFGALAPHEQHWAPGSADTLALTLPVCEPDVTVPVVELFLK